MKPLYSFTVCFTLGVLMPAPARASRPSPDQLAQDSVRLAGIESAKAAAAPWKDSLSAAFAALPDTANREAIADWIFLITYKHPATGPVAADFATAWEKIAAECKSARLNPLEATEAIYRFTNSDWAPVSTAKGPGLDDVKTAKDLAAWGKAVLSAGKKALAAKQAPADVWSRQAASYKARKPADLAKVGLNPKPVRF